MSLAADYRGGGYIDWRLPSRSQLELIQVNTDTTQSAPVLPSGDDGLCSITFSSDGKWILTGSDDCTMKLWDTASGRKVKTFSGHADSVNSVCFSPDGKYVAAGYVNGAIKLWDTGR
jgi:WD40 repeat protein